MVLSKMIRDMRRLVTKGLINKYSIHTVFPTPGISAAGGFTVIALTILLTYKFRYQPLEGDLKPVLGEYSNYRQPSAKSKVSQSAGTDSKCG